MKIKKTLTEKVIQANRSNSRNSPGPTTVSGKANARLNALAHGLLAKCLVFANPQEKHDYDLLHEGLSRQIRPRDLLEGMMVSEIATNYWKLCCAQKWEVASVQARKEICRSVIAALTLQNSELDHEARLPLLDQSEDTFERTSAGWDCTELCIEFENGKDDSETSQHRRVRPMSSSGQSPQHMPQTKEHLERTWDGEGSARTAENQTSVKLGSSLDTIMRYASMIRRDLCRAIVELRQLQQRELRRRG
jgi:hypothetical protein